MVWAKETVALSKLLQRCAVHSGMPPGVLSGVVQEHHECLTSMVQSGNMLDLEMLDVAKKYPLAPTSEGRAPALMPRAEAPVHVTTSSEPSTLEPEEAAPPEELALLPTTTSSCLLPLVG